MKCEEIFAALALLEKERGIPQSFMMGKIIQALTTAYKRDHEDVENVVVDYRDRPEGSESKLNTVSDGMKVLRTIARLFRCYQPQKFFGAIAALLLIISLLFFVPILCTYFADGLVPRFPTLVVCGFTALAAVQCFFAGMQLQNIVQKNKQDFEMQLQHAMKEQREAHEETH